MDDEIDDTWKELNNRLGPIDKVLIHACGDGMVLSTLGQKADLIKRYLAEAGFVIVPTTEELLRRDKESVSTGKVHD